MAAIGGLPMTTGKQEAEDRDQGGGSGGRMLAIC